MKYEVEQKFPFPSPAPPQWNKMLDAGEIQFGEEVCQVDRYFNHPARDFGRTDEAFRLRQVGRQNFVTYKGPRVDAVMKTRKELELELPSGVEVAEQFTELWMALGFRPAGTVRKHRRKAMLNHGDWSCELSYDRVDQLGEFVELEIVCAESELDDARAAVIQLAESLGLAGGERRSYLELLLRGSD